MFDDLHMFNLESSAWTQIMDGDARGNRPVGRKSLGFTSVKQRLFIFGGETNDGNTF
jgi:hypothetical protein